MIPAKILAAQGTSWPDIRRYGRQLCPHEGSWNTLDRRSDVSAEAALSIILVRHLVEKHVLTVPEALSAVAFFVERVTRYAKELFGVVSDLRESGGKTEDIQVPVVMLEVVEGRWVRMGHGSDALFDIEEQQQADIKKVMEGRPAWAAVWSHSVCLLPLFLKICPLDDDDGNEHDAPEDTVGETQ